VQKKEREKEFMIPFLRRVVELEGLEPGVFGKKKEGKKKSFFLNMVEVRSILPVPKKKKEKKGKRNWVARLISNQRPRTRKEEGKKEEGGGGRKKDQDENMSTSSGKC